MSTTGKTPLGLSKPNWTLMQLKSQLGIVESALCMDQMEVFVIVTAPFMVIMTLVLTKSILATAFMVDTLMAYVYLNAGFEKQFLVTELMYGVFLMCNMYTYLKNGKWPKRVKNETVQETVQFVGWYTIVGMIVCIAANSHIYAV